VILPWLRPVGQRLMPGWLAITIGEWTLAWRPLTLSEQAHEACHVAQWRHYGPRFIPRYLRASWRAWRDGGRIYRDNRFEVAARRAAAQAVEVRMAGRRTPPLSRSDRAGPCRCP
jgi:hypothetical protein